MSNQHDRTRQQASLHSTKINASRTKRGQIDPRTIFGGFILIIIAGPLSVAAVDMQSSLASTPAFSWFSASVIALLIVAAIAAAVLGFE